MRGSILNNSQNLFGRSRFDYVGHGREQNHLARPRFDQKSKWITHIVARRLNSSLKIICKDSRVLIVEHELQKPALRELKVAKSCRCYNQGLVGSECDIRRQSDVWLNPWYTLPNEEILLNLNFLTSCEYTAV